MRIVFLPDSPEVWAVAIGILVVTVIGVAIYQWLRPPATKKLIEDPRYLQALDVYAAGLPGEAEPSRQDRQAALAAAVECLAKEHGVAAEEAERGLRLLIAEYDKDRSYELRHQALTYEQAGAYDLALDYFERAARLREEHDPEDYQFLQRCAARVRGKARTGKGQ
jgi:hypothetical protein